MKVSRWGDSLAVRLPAAVVKSFNLKEGDEVVVLPAHEGEPQIERKLSKEEALERLKAFEGRFTTEWKFDRDEANAR